MVKVANRIEAELHENLKHFSKREFTIEKEEMEIVSNSWVTFIKVWDNNLNHLSSVCMERIFGVINAIQKEYYIDVDWHIDCPNNTPRVIIDVSVASK